MTISASFLDELRSRLTLSDIIGRKVKLTRAGREFKGCCPFHREKTPSFTVNDDKHFYHCFGCGAHGDAVGFLMKHDNLSFPEAVEVLASQAGMQVPRPDPKDVERETGRKNLFSLMDAAATYFERSLYEPQNASALGYMSGRGLSEETLRAYRVGFAPEDPQLLVNHLRGVGYAPEDMILTGLVKPGREGRAPYAFFRGRIMFPVLDRGGRCVAFGGRIMPDHLRPPDGPGFTPPKYINSPDSPLFHKSRVLYGEGRARQYAAKGGRVLVVEGYMDVIACAQGGFEGAVAPMGTALTEEQIVLLWKLSGGDVKEPVLCFDGDSAGRRAAERARDRILPLLQPSQSARFAFLPEGEDPDSLIRARGPEAFESVLTRSLSLCDFLWFSLTSGKLFNTPEAQAGLKKNLLDMVAGIADRDVQQLYQQRLMAYFSQAFFGNARQPSGGPYEKGRGGKFGGGTGRTPGVFSGQVRGPRQRPGKPVDQRLLCTRILIAGLLNHPHIFDSVEEALGCLAVEQARLDSLRQELIAVLSGNPLMERDDLVRDMVERGFGEEINDILCESLYVHASFCSPRAQSEAVAACWMAFWRDFKGGIGAVKRAKA